MLYTSFLGRAIEEDIKGFWLDEKLRIYTEKEIDMEETIWSCVVVNDVVAGIFRDSDTILVKFTKVNNRQEMFEYMNKPEYQEYLKKPVKVLDAHWIDTGYVPSDWWWLGSPYLSPNPTCLEAGKTKWPDMRSIYAEIITYPYDFGTGDVYITVDPWREEFVIVW